MFRFCRFLIILSAMFFGVGSLQANQPQSKRFLGEKDLLLPSLEFSSSENSSLEERQENLIAKKRRKKRRKRRKKSNSKSAVQSEPVNTLWYFSPLGMGQFKNDSPILGGAFAGIQVVSFALGMTGYLAANAEVEATNVYIDERNTEFETINEAQQADHTNETDAEVSKRESDYNAIYSQSQLYFALFAVAWVGSTIEAFINQPSAEIKSKPKKRSRRKKRKKRKKRSMIEQEILDVEETAANYMPLKSKYGLQVLPIATRTRKDIALNFSVNF